MPFVSMERRGGLADLAELYATVLTETGTILQSRGHRDMASLLAERLSGGTDVEMLSRDLASILTSLDDRHFVSVQCTSSGITPQDTTSTEVMSELCFHKNARRLLHAVSAASRAPPGCDALHKDKTCLAAPSARGINALLRLGVLTSHAHRLDTQEGADEGDEGGEGGHSNSRTLLRHVERGGMGSEVALRAVAVVACQRLAAAVQAQLSGGTSGADEVVISPLKMSIYLDSVVNSVGEGGVEGASVENSQNDVKGLFIPKESGRKW